MALTWIGRAGIHRRAERRADDFSAHRMSWRQRTSFSFVFRK